MSLAVSLLTTQRDKLKTQRDELLAALEDTLTDTPHLKAYKDGVEQDCSPRCPRCRGLAAIARAKGEEARE